MRNDVVSGPLESLVTRFDTLIRGVARQHDLPDSDVDELVQEVRIRIWKALGAREKIAGAPASYVYRTAMSAAVDLIRRRRARREDALEVAVVRGEAIVSAASSPDAAVQTAEAMQALAQAIDALSESRRPVVRMYLAGYGREEIASLLGWSEAKTRNLLYRGLADLRAELQRRGLAPEVTV